MVFIYQMFGQTEPIFTAFTFDTVPMGKTGSWVASEASEDNDKIKRHTYVSPVAQLAQGDEFEISMPVVSDTVLADPFSFKVKVRNFEVKNSEFLSWKKNLVKFSHPLDSSRCCDLETLVHSWKTPTGVEYGKGLRKLLEYMSQFMELVDEKYDYYKFYLYRFEFVATKVGTIKQNNFIDMNVEIKPKNCTLTKVLRSQSQLTKGSNVELRLGDTFVLYMTDL